jgi:ubiquitin-conjugating enzyme E2 M
MIKLFSLKQQGKEGGTQQSSQKSTAAFLRVQKGIKNNMNKHCGFVSIDLAELNLPKTCQMDFPDPNDLLNFKLVITPDEVTPTTTNPFN